MEFYEQGTTANGMDDNNADMLLVLEERSISWSVNSDYSGQELYLVVDNRPALLAVVQVRVRGNHSSNGSHSNFATTITNASDLATIDVGAEVTLDAQTLQTFRSNDENGFQTDTNGDGFYDASGSTITVS